MDWKDIPQVLELTKENIRYKEYLKSHQLEFRFMSFLDRELQPDDENISYYCTFGFDGDNNQYDLGLWGGSKEEIINRIKSDNFINEAKKYPQSYYNYQLQRVVNEFKNFAKAYVIKER